MYVTYQCVQCIDCQWQNTLGFPRPNFYPPRPAGFSPMLTWDVHRHFSALTYARKILRPVLNSLGREQLIAMQFEVRVLRMKKIIATCAGVRVCGRVAMTFLFYTIMTMSYYTKLKPRGVYCLVWCAVCDFRYSPTLTHPDLPAQNAHNFFFCTVPHTKLLGYGQL